MSTTPPPPPPSVLSSPPPQFEIRLYGLNPAGKSCPPFSSSPSYAFRLTTDHLINFFSSNTRVLGVLLHPSPQSDQEGTLHWAQVWVGSESDVQRCLELKQHLISSGITLTRAPASIPQRGLLTPEMDDMPSFPLQLRTPPTPPSFTRGVRPDLSGLGYRHLDPQAPLPRNLYIMGMPLDLTQLQFRALFTTYGMVEHSTLLSQLDGLGRRRGFILMSTHREATTAMQAMNGKWIDGSKLDVSWALVQREARQFGMNGHGAMPNRVVHPPTVPTRRDPPEEWSVNVENLDPLYFPNAGVIREIFAHFGPISRVTVLSASPLHVLIAFEHEVSARALLDANGMSLGGRAILTRRPTPSPRLTFDPFGHDLLQRLSKLSVQTPGLSADSEPFIPFAAAVGQGLASELDASPTRDSTSSKHSGGDSNSTKVSSGSGKDPSTPLNKSQDHWQSVPLWCEWCGVTDTDVYEEHSDDTTLSETVET